MEFYGISTSLLTFRQVTLYKRELMTLLHLVINITPLQVRIM